MWADEQKIKLSIANTGRTHTEETKQKMSKDRKGENHCQFGKPLSEERKQKIGLSNLSKIYIEETKLKMSISHKGLQAGEKNGMFGVRHSQELKERQAEAVRTYYQNNPHKGCREIIDTATLEIYKSIKDVCYKNNMVYSTLAGKLSGHDRNNTSFTYLDYYVEANRSSVTVDSHVDSEACPNVKVEIDLED